MRSRSTCDIEPISIEVCNVAVSISDEKPLHMRLAPSNGLCCEFAQFQSQMRSRSTCDQTHRISSIESWIGFNLRREAAPHATALPFVPQQVQICFNLRREAAPHATELESCKHAENIKFQSQTRSRSTCDFPQPPSSTMPNSVSISDEKPLHMRQRRPANSPSSHWRFNLRREAAPHATS